MVNVGTLVPSMAEISNRAVECVNHVNAKEKEGKMNFKSRIERGFFRLTVVISICVWLCLFIGFCVTSPWESIIDNLIVASLWGGGIWVFYCFIKYIVIKYIVAGFKNEAKNTKQGKTRQNKG
ncbi:MAG: hypothetical protein COT45_03510 [bacterium (Candidatus Stahlbacteria) CG08_land_8_20_14_0_20_40_26]|nr:MAG: hypothetical protein COT45_03510 [bacterium (Candidatus Stahlbacteria) CG08_land_8_20_14_0_20_40_26]